MLFLGIREAVDASRLVVVLPVQGIPSAIVVHEGLPPVKERLKVCELPAARFELVICSVVNVNVFEVDDHDDLVAVVAHGFQHLVCVLHEGHLANAEGVVFLEDITQSLQVFVQSWPVGVPFVCPLPDAPRVLDRCIWEALVLADKVDDVHSESICSLV